MTIKRTKPRFSTNPIWLAKKGADYINNSKERLLREYFYDVLTEEQRNLFRDFKEFAAESKLFETRYTA